MNTEKSCRILCMTNSVNPDAIARYWRGPKPPEAGDGPVREWMTWIGTVERKPTPQSKEKEQNRADLQRMIDDSAPDRKVTPRYSFGE